MFSKSDKDIFYKLCIIIIFTLGIILRSYSFIIYRPLWRDECSLALSIYFGSFSDLWGVLYHVQSAPPIFMTICKLINGINPYFPEYFLRIFPYVCGVISIYLFFLVSKKFFKSKYAIIISNFAFAINMQLIYYSHEFKQYSTDVMITLACILYLSGLNLSNLSKKQILINAAILALLPLLSISSLFVIAAWLFICLLKKNNIKSLILTFIPIFFINILYYLFILKPSQEIMLDKYGFLWEKGFLSFNFDSIYYVLQNNLSFYFQQCNHIIIPIILTLVGLIFAIRRNSEIDKLIVTFFLIVIVASFMSLYPIQERVSLYLLPLIILLTVMPLNLSNRIWMKILCSIFIFCILFGKNHYSIIDHNYENPALMMQIIKAKYMKNDFVIYNDVSDSQYEIYSYIYSFRVPDNRLGRIQLADYGEEWYYSVLDQLPKGNRYWFFYSYDIVTKPVITFLKNWAHKNGQILYELNPNHKSYLLYVQL